MRPTDIASSMINKIGESPFYLNQNAAEMLNNLSDDYLTQTGYLESIASKAPIRNGLPIPWITYSALEFLEKSVSSSSRILEFGGGFSTLFWALRGNPISYMENNVLWDDAIHQVGQEFRNLLPNSITRISELMTSDMRSELKTSLVREVTISKVEFSEHLNDFFVDQINQTELIVIDGDFRNYFLDLSSQSKTASHVILDNGDRAEYSFGINCMMKAGWSKVDFHGLGPINPYGWTTSIFFKKVALDINF
jgi:hypothetical protein